MKTLSSLALGVLFSGSVAAQSSADNLRPNYVKLNIFPIALKTISLQYERGLGKHISVSLGLRLQPKGSLPFKNSILNSLESTDTTARDFVSNAQMSNWAITPEFRYYLGKKPQNGFYIAPFLRIGGNKLDWNYNYRKDDGTIKPVAFNGTVNSFGGGILFGAQWHLRSNIILDWWIIGPMYSSQKLSLNANADLSDLTTKEREDLQENLEGLELFGQKVEAEVTSKGASASNTFAMPGLRTGFCIGYCF